jgi:hypothetical protein
MQSFKWKALCYNRDFNNYNLDAKISYIKNKLNRPIRVCGVVKNEEEPGGGPFGF